MMPEDDGVVEIPVLEKTMADLNPIDLPPNVAAQGVQRLNNAATTAHENFITHQNVITYDHLEQKRMVTLDEAIGAREVQAKVTPGGPAPAA